MRGQMGRTAATSSATGLPRACWRPQVGGHETVDTFVYGGRHLSMPKQRLSHYSMARAAFWRILLTGSCIAGMKTQHAAGILSGLKLLPWTAYLCMAAGA